MDISSLPVILAREQQRYFCPGAAGYAFAAANEFVWRYRIAEMHNAVADDFGISEAGTVPGAQLGPFGQENRFPLVPMQADARYIAAFGSGKPFLNRQCSELASTQLSLMRVGILK